MPVARFNSEVACKIATYLNLQCGTHVKFITIFISSPYQSMPLYNDVVKKLLWVGWLCGVHQHYFIVLKMSECLFLHSKWQISAVIKISQKLCRAMHNFGVSILFVADGGDIPKPLAEITHKVIIYNLRHKMWFQQDGVSPNFFRAVTKWRGLFGLEIIFHPTLHYCLWRCL